MEGTLVATTTARRTGEPGLKKGAINYASSVVIGVASTAPGYSLAAVARAGRGGRGRWGPGARGDDRLVHPDPVRGAGPTATSTAPTRTAARRSAGRRRRSARAAGWIGGWAIIVADIIVMANLAQIAGLYTFLLFDRPTTPSTFAVTVVGVVWIAVMTWICVIGIELNAKTQRWLLTAEIVTLAIFAVVALVRVWTGDAARLDRPDAVVVLPFAIGSCERAGRRRADRHLHLLGLGQPRDGQRGDRGRRHGPGQGGGQRDADPARHLRDRLDRRASPSAASTVSPTTNRATCSACSANDVFGSDLLGKIVIIAVLTSAAASTQTTILPTARTSLSMARARAHPGDVRPHPRALPDAGRLDDLDGWAVDRLVCRPDDRRRRTSSSTRSPRSA